MLVGHEQQAHCEIRSGKDGALLLDFDCGWEEVIPLSAPLEQGSESRTYYYPHKNRKPLWTSAWPDRGATTGLSLALVENAAGVPEVLVGFSDWYWHGPPAAPVGELRQLSLAMGKALWELRVERLAELRKDASQPR